MTLLAAPALAQSIDPDTESMLLFGIDRTTGELRKHDFAERETTGVGTIRTADGAVLSGIDASTHLPEHLNLMAFWSDPDEGHAWLVYVNAETAAAALVGEGFGVGHVAGAAAAPSAADPAKWNVFAVQNLDAEADEPIEFDIDEDRVVPRESFAARVTVIGAAISYAGQYEVPVTTQLRVGGQPMTPFGPFGDPEAGNVNDGHNPRQFILPDEYDPGTPIDVLARSWVRQSSGWWGWSWQQFLSVDGSSHGSQQLIVLRNGDAVPDIEGFQNQGNVRDFVGDYIDPVTDTIVLDQNEAIFLFELGTTDMDSEAADFQDLVVLVTLARHRSELEDDGGDGDGGSEHVRYVVENHGRRVKFEDAPVGLGEDGAHQSDRFVIDVHNGGQQVGVITKAAWAQDANMLTGVGDEVLDSLGFRTRLVSIDGGTYTLVVTSESNQHALSHVEFDFGPGREVQSPDDEYDAVRNGASDSDGGPKARLLRVNHITGGYEQLMTLARPYDSLATLNGRTFYATAGTELVELDVDDQTETLIGSTTHANVFGLAFVNLSLRGFENAGDRLVPIDPVTGGPLATGMSIGLQNLGTIVFMPAAADPAGKPRSYD